MVIHLPRPSWVIPSAVLFVLPAVNVRLVGPASLG
jgi:hypothetical protein